MPRGQQFHKNWCDRNNFFDFFTNVIIVAWRLRNEPIQVLLSLSWSFFWRKDLLRLIDQIQGQTPFTVRVKLCRQQIATLLIFFIRHNEFEWSMDQWMANLCYWDEKWRKIFGIKNSVANATSEQKFLLRVVSTQQWRRLTFPSIEPFTRTFQ